MKSLVIGLVLLLPALAAAHKPSDAFVTLHLSGATLHGRWELSLRDLNEVFGLDTDGDGSIRWGELKAREEEIGRWALPHLTVSGCSLATKGLEVVRHTDGAYAALQLTGACTGSAALQLRYDLLFDSDALHRGLLNFRAGALQQAFIFASDRREVQIDPGERSDGRELLATIRQGVGHIWAGLDHLLFLLALLLPSVARRERGGGWTVSADLGVVARDTLKVITGFTVGHSLTLSLGALGWLALPSRFVETGIAASVALAALNNLTPILRSDRWLAAVALGLLHGFGFSSALSDLGLEGAPLFRALIGFNVGVELGQCAVVAVLLPVAYAMRSTTFYRRAVVDAGSAVILTVAVIWCVERALLIRILPFTV